MEPFALDVPRCIEEEDDDDEEEEEQNRWRGWVEQEE